MRYLIVIEPTSTGFSAYAPDVPGCITTGRTREETVALMREALEFHFEGLHEDGEPIPESSSIAKYVDVVVPVAPKTKR